MSETIYKEGIDKNTVSAVEELSAYKYGFTTNIESLKAPKGLTEETVRFISAKKEEPLWLLEWRLKAFERWQKMEEPVWANVSYPAIDYQDHYYYAEPKAGAKYESIDDVPEELRVEQVIGFIFIKIITEQQIRVELIVVNGLHRRQSRFRCRCFFFRRFLNIRFHHRHLTRTELRTRQLRHILIRLLTGRLRPGLTTHTLLVFCLIIRHRTL